MSRRVKNVIVVDDTADNLGGTAQIAYVTAAVLRDRGYNVVYFAGCGPIHERLAGFRVVVAHERPFLDAPNMVNAALEGIHSSKSYEELRGLLAEFDSMDTVVHIHSWTHALSSSIFDAIADEGFKSVVTLHDYFLMCPNGGFYDYQKNEICHLEPCSRACVLRNCDKRSYAQKLYRLWRIARQTKSIGRAKPTLCYLSDFTYDILRGNPFDDGKPVYLPNPIAVEDSVCLGNPRKKTGYLFVGRLDKEKNPELFCRALARLGLRGTICGDGPELERLKSEYPNLEFKGWCDKRELSEQFFASRALVMTSSCYEASPLVCLEAMFASGIPSVVPDTCGATAYIKNRENGLWFRSGDVDSLCESLSQIEDQVFYERMCRNIAADIDALRSDRSYATYASRIISLYEEQNV